MSEENKQPDIEVIREALDTSVSVPVRSSHALKARFADEEDADIFACDTINEYRELIQKCQGVHKSQGHLRTEPQWQPIETAPKDGTLVLLLNIHDNYRIGSYEPNYQNRKWGTGWEGGDWDFRIDFDPQPTHWMPLPTPPK